MVLPRKPTFWTPLSYYTGRGEGSQVAEEIERQFQLASIRSVRLNLRK